jgi:hypothetical protein
VAARHLLAAAGAVLIAVTSTTSLEAQGRGRDGNPGRGSLRREAERRVIPAKPLPRSFEEPAFARGYTAGEQRGRDDARRKARYDPVGSREYRDGDSGYEASYGTREAYRNNYRAGFRQGYEYGYRTGN